MSLLLLFRGHPAGTIAASLQPLTAALSGTSKNVGTIAASLQPLTSAGSGTQEMTGTIAASLQPLAAAASGYMVPTGTISVTLGALTAALAGEFRYAPDLNPYRRLQPGSARTSFTQRTVSRVGRNQPGTSVRKWL